MSDVNHKPDAPEHDGVKRLGLFSNRWYADYVFPVIAFLVMGVIIVGLEWVYAESGYGFETNKPSPRTYRIISPRQYIDRAATDELRRKVG